MNDDFIKQALPEVSKEFEKSLYAKISVEPKPVRSNSIARKYRRTYIFATLVTVLLLVAWSQLRFWVRYVPVGEMWLVEYSHQEHDQAQGPVATVFVPTPRPENWITITLESGEEAIVTLGGCPAAFSMPTWVPDGFSGFGLSENETWYTDSFPIYENSAQERIFISFGLLNIPRMHPYAPTGMYEQVSVNGGPAILIHGRLALTDPENPTTPRKWDESLGLQLHWVLGEHVYMLETYGPYLSAEELIHMAESVPQPAAECVGLP